MAARFMFCRVINSQDGVEENFAGTGWGWNGSSAGMGGDE